MEVSLGVDRHTISCLGLGAIKEEHLEAEARQGPGDMGQALRHHSARSFSASVFFALSHIRSHCCFPMAASCSGRASGNYIR